MQNSTQKVLNSILIKFQMLDELRNEVQHFRRLSVRKSCDFGVAIDEVEHFVWGSWLLFLDIIPIFLKQFSFDGELQKTEFGEGFWCISFKNRVEKSVEAKRSNKKIYISKWLSKIVKKV